MKTAMQHAIKEIAYLRGRPSDTPTYSQIFKVLEDKLEKEKEQIQKAFSDGQETPMNHPTLPHYSRDEYYNDNYNQNK